MMTTRDKKWIELIKTGGNAGEKAFHELSVFYGPRLYAQIIKITNDTTLTKDILQEVFIKTWLHLPKFEERSTLYSWLYRITHNETIGILRKERKRTHLSINNEIVEILPGHSTLEGHSAEEILSVLYAAIQVLPQKQAEVFELKYFQQQTFKEIEALTGTSQGALKASYHIAKKKITAFINLKLNH
jgi:RNA polymerase sigma factor (sigma-70 family)